MESKYPPKRRQPKSAADTLRAARGNVPGFLGLAELAKLTGAKVEHLKPTSIADLERKRGALSSKREHS